MAAGITVRGFQNQIAADPGFEAERLISFSVRLPASRYGDDRAVDDFYERAVDDLERHPGVLAATSTSRLPLGATGTSLFRSFIFDGATPPPEGVEYGALWVEVDPHWFETVGVPAAEGRTITEDDDASAPFVAIVNRRMARMMTQDESIVGRAIRSYWDENVPRTVQRRAPGAASARRLRAPCAGHQTGDDVPGTNRRRAVGDDPGGP